MSTPRGCLIDLDGTVWTDDQLIPGASDAIARLRSAGIPFRFATNTTRKPRSQLARELTALGIETATEECITAPSAAAAWLRERGARKISALIAEASHEDLAEFELDDESPEFVLVGDLGSDWTFEILDCAFRALLGGAELVAIQRNRFWRTGGRLSLDAGPFVAALEYGSGKEAQLVGKPSRAFFRAAVGELGLWPHEVVMVGDDLEADIEGAAAAGLRSVALRTGKYLPESEPRAASRATVVLDSIADLPDWLGLR